MDSLNVTLNPSTEVFVDSFTLHKMFDLGGTLNQITKHLHFIFYALTEIYLLVSSRDYCKAPAADRVPKVSTKKCQVTPSWHKCHFAPPPPPQKLKVSISGQMFRSEFKKCYLTSPPQCKVGIFGQILTSGLQIFKVPLCRVTTLR